jgi:hypothetical protein
MMSVRNTKLVTGNRSLRAGLILLGIYLAVQMIGRTFFEVRDERLFYGIQALRCFLMPVLGVLLIRGLFKWENNFKWFFIIPVTLFCLSIFMSSLFASIGSQPLIREDAEVLYVHATDARRKIIRQGPPVVVLGGSLRTDTLVVFEFSRYIRFARKARMTELKPVWIKIRPVTTWPAQN